MKGPFKVQRTLFTQCTVDVAETVVGFDGLLEHKQCDRPHANSRGEWLRALSRALQHDVEPSGYSSYRQSLRANFTCCSRTFDRSRARIDAGADRHACHRRGPTSSRHATKKLIVRYEQKVELRTTVMPRSYGTAQIIVLPKELFLSGPVEISFLPGRCLSVEG